MKNERVEPLLLTGEEIITKMSDPKSWEIRVRDGDSVILAALSPDFKIIGPYQESWFNFIYMVDDQRLGAVSNIGGDQWGFLQDIDEILKRSNLFADIEETKKIIENFAKKALQEPLEAQRLRDVEQALTQLKKSNRRFSFRGCPIPNVENYKRLKRSIYDN